MEIHFGNKSSALFYILDRKVTMTSVGANKGEARLVLESFSDLARLSADFSDDVDLVGAGPNSGDLIRLLAEVERRRGIELDVDDLPHRVSRYRQSTACSSSGWRPGKAPKIESDFRDYST